MKLQFEQQGTLWGQELQNTLLSTISSVSKAPAYSDDRFTLWSIRKTIEEGRFSKLTFLSADMIKPFSKKTFLSNKPKTS